MQGPHCRPRRRTTSTGHRWLRHGQHGDDHAHRWHACGLVGAAAPTSSRARAPGSPTGGGHPRGGPANVALIAFIAICTFAQWAVWSVKRQDRGHAALRSASRRSPQSWSLMPRAFIYAQVGLGISDGAYATMFYAITGMFTFLMIIGVVFTAVTAFRSIGGRSDNAIVVAHAIYWYTMAAIFSASGSSSTSPSESLMFTTGSKILIGGSVLATVAAIVYGVSQNEALGIVGLISAAIAWVCSLASTSGRVTRTCPQWTHSNRHVGRSNRTAGGQHLADGLRRRCRHGARRTRHPTEHLHHWRRHHSRRRCAVDGAGLGRKRLGRQRGQRRRS